MVIRNKHIKLMKGIYKEEEIPIEEVNFFGIRNIENIEDDVFDDIIGVFTKEVLLLSLGTTDPGTYFNKPGKALNKKGTMHLCLGYHPKMWKLGKHGGRKGYPALVNRWDCGKQRVWRDTDKDMRFSTRDMFDEGIFNGNLHRCPIGYNIKKGVKYNSAGCQVFAYSNDFDSAYIVAKLSKQKYFSYRLFQKYDIPFYEEEIKRLLK